MTTYYCSKCDNAIMTTFERAPKGQTPEEYVEFLKAKKWFRENGVCKCCRYPKEINCISGCKMYEHCDNPLKKEKRKSVRYMPYPSPK